MCPVAVPLSGFSRKAQLRSGIEKIVHAVALLKFLDLARSWTPSLSDQKAGFLFGRQRKATHCGD
jgi:hypothetical protein